MRNTKSESCSFLQSRWSYWLSARLDWQSRTSEAHHCVYTSVGVLPKWINKWAAAEWGGSALNVGNVQEPQCLEGKQSKSWEKRIRSERCASSCVWCLLLPCSHPLMSCSSLSAWAQHQKLSEEFLTFSIGQSEIDDAGCGQNSSRLFSSPTCRQTVLGYLLPIV